MTDIARRRHVRFRRVCFSLPRIAREALERHVSVARFRELRRKVLPFAEAQGLVTDENVFGAVS